MVTGQVLPTRSGLAVKDTVFETSENVIAVLNYCLRDCIKGNKETCENEMARQGNIENEDDKKKIYLDGLPLCLLPDDHLELFLPANKKFKTGFSDLFPEKPRPFLHQKVFESISQRPLLDGECFKYFGLDQFADLLEKNQEKSNQLINKNAPLPVETCSENIRSWLCRVWKFLCNYRNQQERREKRCDLSRINSWSLALVHQKEVEYLLPIAKRTHALYFQETLPIKDMLVNKIGVFQPVHSFYPNNQEKRFFGELTNPNHVIDAIDLVNNGNNMDLTLTSEEASQILTHLATYFANIENPSKLKSLVLFERFDGKLTAVNDNQKRIVMMPDYIPFNGLHVIEANSACIFLKHQRGRFKELYRQLDIICMEWFKFYTSFILQFIEDLGNDEIKPHLLHLKTMVERCKKEEKEAILLNLRHYKLFPNRLGNRVTCSTMYDPTNTIFHTMLPDDFFPDQEFCEYQWLGFLKQLGLISELTSGLFVMFCEELASSDDLEKVAKVSGLLCGNLTSDEQFYQNPTFLQRIGSIEFLIPHGIVKKLEEIHPSKNSKVEKISYRSSCIHTLEKLVWTSKHVLPDYSTSCLNNNAKSWLGVIEKNNLDFASVYSNFENILVNSPDNFRQITTTYREIKNSLVNSYFDVMKKLYDSKFINNDKFKLISCVLVNSHLKHGLDVPRRAVQSQEEHTIYPYLNVIPIQLGQYFEVLSKLGCSKDVKPYHLVDVLQEVRTISKGEPMDPKEQKDAKKAFCVLSQKISEYKNELVENVLYLPSVSFVEPSTIRMKESTECIYVDESRLEKRLQKFSSPLLMFSYEEYDKNQNANKNLVEGLLPKERRPRSLNQSITEILDEESSRQTTITVDSQHISKVIKRRIKNPVFIDCVERLFAHENLECGSVAKSLSNVQVFVKRNITTVLSYKGEVIPESELVQKIFMRVNDDQLEIYFSADALADQELTSSVAECLLIALGNRLTSKECILSLPLLLTQDIGKLSDMLDTRKISRGTGDSAYKKLGAQPIPGDPVPLELHSLLRQDFSSFEKGDYVAVKQIDDDADDNDAHYHYGIFHRMDPNPNIADRFYGIQLEEDEDIITDVPAYSVFKFERGFIKNENAFDFALDFNGQSFEEICKGIKKIFDGIKNMDKNTRKLIIRRLYLTWHPDKHPDETKELATKVFQYIQKLINKAEGEISTNYTSGWDTYARDWSRRYREYTESYKRSNWGGRYYSSSSYSLPTFRSLNPQPAEARRWWRQATFDIGAAKEIHNHHEWACYIAHQVR